MRYYIRHDNDVKVEGPFTIEALTKDIRSGRIPREALASSDLGEDVGSLLAYRSYDWFSLAAIAELRGVLPPVPESPATPRRLTLFTVLTNVVLALTVLYRAITEQLWFMGLLAIVLVYSAVHMTFHVVRQREPQNPVV